MELNQLLTEAEKWSEVYRNKVALGSDEELQMLASAYATLFLRACANKSVKELADAHEVIADCFRRLGDQNWSVRHAELAAAYKALP
jgi:hypothetical protein